ncbi:hypothetical protein [Salinivibrio sp. MA427]|uniref:hypothetical protein n=1 Tax=Salinivibrio sp. MA427 TaxID=1909455 RepID=UPI0018FEDB8D|nr:hypothetical protein [Salinivibrio sp. MA427]
MKIDNAVVVITAGGSSSGRAMAEHFCSLGADVALLDTEWPALRLSADQCRRYVENADQYNLAVLSGGSARGRVYATTWSPRCDH